MKMIGKYLIVTLIVLLLVNVTACSGKEEETNSSKETVNIIDEGTDKEIGTDETLIIDMEDMTWSFKTGGGIASSPIIENNTIFFGSKDGNLYAVDLDTKLELWHYNSNGPILCQPAIHNGFIFFSSSEVFFALDINTGEEIWKYDTKADDNQKMRKDKWDYHDSSPVVDNNVVYFGSGTGFIYGFDVATGEVVWDFATTAESIVRQTPLINDGIMYIGDWSGLYYAIDISTKQAMWTQKYSGSFQSSSVIYENILVYGGRDSKMHAVEKSNGQKIWSYPVGSWASGDPSIVDGVLYYPSSDTKLVYAMKVENGRQIKRYKIYKNSFAKSIIIDNILYITSGDAYEEPGTGKVQAFKLDGDGKSIWEINVDMGAVYTTPVIFNDTIYFGSEDGSLYGMQLN